MRCLGSSLFYLILFCGLLGAISTVCAADDNLLANGDFAKVNEKGLPVSWQVDQPQWIRVDKDEKPDGAEQSLRIDIKETHSGLGQILQKHPVSSNEQYLISAMGRSSQPGEGILQVKFLKDRKELNRIEIGRTVGSWGKIEKQITAPADADQIQVLLRYQRDNNDVGETVWFTQVKLLHGAAASPSEEPAKQAAKSATPRNGLAGGIVYLSPDGNDTAAGTRDAPRRTVQLALDQALPGDVIHLLPGVYHQHAMFTGGGQFDKPVVLEGDDGAILDGSESFDPQWRAADDVGPGVYRTKVPFEPRAVFIDGKFLTMLQEKRVVKGGAKSGDWLWPNLFRNGVRGRWDGVRGLGLYLHGSGELVVRLPQGQDPQQAAITMAPDGPLVLINGADRCVIRNVRLRYAKEGVHIENSLGSVVERCHIGPVRDGVWLGPGSDRCTIRFNDITQNPLNDQTTGTNYAWDSWIARKWGGYYDSMGIMIDRTVGGHRIHDNDIHDVFDGISTVDSVGNQYLKVTAKQRLDWSAFNRDLDVHHNRIERTNDDALEPNDGAINGQWHDNLVIHARCGFRVKTIDVGPLYIYRNIFLHCPEDVRFYGQIELNPAVVYVYQNTSTSREALASNKIFGIGLPNYHVFNNLFWCETWWHNSGKSIEPNWIGDYNVYVRRGLDSQWDAQHQLATGLKIDTHSRWVDSSDAPSPFSDAAHDDVSLSEQSPARGAGADLTQLVGRALPGYQSPTEGATPDVGALPFGQRMPQLPRDPAAFEVEPAGHWPGSAR